MNPRNNPKADTYILAWKGILHSKELNRLTMQRKMRQIYLIFSEPSFDQNIGEGQA
jgi:hypothetical protein